MRPPAPLVSLSLGGARHSGRCGDGRSLDVSAKRQQSWCVGGGGALCGGSIPQVSACDRTNRDALLIVAQFDRADVVSLPAVVVDKHEVQIVGVESLEPRVRGGGATRYRPDEGASASALRVCVHQSDNLVRRSTTGVYLVGLGQSRLAPLIGGHDKLDARGNILVPKSHTFSVCEIGNSEAWIVVTGVSVAEFDGEAVCIGAAETAAGEQTDVEQRVVGQ